MSSIGVRGGVSRGKGGGSSTGGGNEAEELQQYQIQGRVVVVAFHDGGG